MSEDVCPWNRRFASDLREPAFAAREALTGRARRRRDRVENAEHERDLRRVRRAARPIRGGRARVK